VRTEAHVHEVHPDVVGAVRGAALPDVALQQATRVFKLLGDPTRARLLYALLDGGEVCVCDLAAAIGAAEATVSQALRLLRASDVVVARREGRLAYYRLADEHVRLLLGVAREHVTHPAGAP
jgi:DNA-binding transcriptional ArsR family regulator